ncbi:flagellar basal body P-ring protein FlgI [Pirellulimonas nuda]|nr:flagellar basal body P-ring protein FlgI [Pirellulimonas nuda]
MTSLLRSSPESVVIAEPTGADNARYIARYTQPQGLDYVKIEAVALATGLDGSGSDPAPSSQRAALLTEMSREKVENPNRVLLSPDTSLVLLRTVLRPGVQEGDRIDVEVRVPARSETKSLRSGWVLAARMSELAALDGIIRSGHVLAIAEGPILVDPSTEEDKAEAVQGRILGGAVATKSRSLGLIIGHEHRSKRMLLEITKAINLRMHIYRGGRKEGVATPKDETFIEIAVHDRYKENVSRMVRVLREVVIDESPAELQHRLTLLESQLLDPLTASKASLRLEAIGTDQAAEILERGAKSSDPEVRFYSAEALAYLDRTSAVEPLVAAAREQRAFRVNALAALSTMDNVLAYEGLRSLLSTSSVETRYGAFRSLWLMNENDPLVSGERMGGQFTYHVLDVEGPPVIHLTRSHRPEIVLFGVGQQLQLPLMLDAGRHILVNGMQGSEITVSKFAAGEEPQKRVVPPTVDAVVRAIVELGGAYPDVVQALQQAKRDGALASRLEVDALPKTGRAYDREAEIGSDDVEALEDADEVDAVEPDAYRVATPLPDLFSGR